MRFSKTLKLRAVCYLLIAVSLSLFFNAAKSQIKASNEVITIKGKVTAEKDNQPLVGVSVFVQNSKKLVAITDAAGIYQIKVTTH